MVARPMVSVIIATYNRSNVLRYAVESVLRQTLHDWELIVVGDCCSDDSAEVVRSFADSRVRWFNLPENSGGQSLPHNFGLARARGTYVAYLGHDDLWHPKHLQQTTGALIEQAADLAYALTILYGKVLHVTGITPAGLYEPGIGLPSSSLVHRRRLIEEIGGWTPYQQLVVPPDQDLVLRTHQAGKKIVCVPELTVFKFPARNRTNCYRDRPEHEQAALWRRMIVEPDFRYRETLRALLRSYDHERTIRIDPDENIQALFEHLRRLRGLPPLAESKPQESNE